jgi:hypothetical protein
MNSEVELTKIVIYLEIPILGTVINNFAYLST